MKNSTQEVHHVVCDGAENYPPQATGLTRLQMTGLTGSQATGLTRLQIALQAVLLCVIAVILSGCYAKREVTLPDTFPVSGQVVASSGQIPAGYQIQFTPSDPEKAAFGFLEPDGSFKLSTRYMGIECEGAASGIYRISLIPPLALCNQGVQPATLPQPIEISAEIADLEISFPNH